MYKRQVFYLRDAFDTRKKLSAFLVRQGAQVNFDSLTDAQLLSLIHI